MKVLRSLSLAAALSVSAVVPAQAAFLIIDDSNPDTITITAGDFEHGINVNGSLLTSGIGNSGSVTLADGGYSIDGSWVDLGLTAGAVDIFFAFGTAPDNVTSGLAIVGSTDGLYGTFSGSFGGLTGGTYFISGPTVGQDGHTENASFPFLSIAFTSEAPEPMSAALALLGLGAMGLTRRRRS